MKLRVLGTAAAMAASALVMAWGGTTTSEAASPLGACVEMYAEASPSLGKGQVRLQERGITAVGGVGLSISGSAELSTGGGEVVIGTGSDEDTTAMSNAYRSAGRSVLADARAAGVGRQLIRKLCEDALAEGEFALMATSGSGTIIDSLCASDNSADVEWDGCVTRYRNTSDGDPDWNYGVDDAQAFGHETNWEPWLDLHKGGVRNNYNTSRVDIVKASPSSDVTDVSECRNSTFGVSAAGFGVTSGGTICPDRWNITRTGISAVPEYHKTQWEGQSNADREANALTAYRFVPGYSNNFSLIINWDVH